MHPFFWIVNIIYFTNNHKLQNIIISSYNYNMFLYMYYVIFLIRQYITNEICDITIKRMMQLWGEEERKY